MQPVEQSARHRVAGQQCSRLRIPQEDAAVRMAGDMEERLNSFSQVNNLAISQKVQTRAWPDWLLKNTAFS